VNNVKNRNIRTVLVCLGLALSITFARNGISDTPKPSQSTSQSAERHASSLPARITLPDGTYRTATLDGVGCTAAICSRVFVEARTDDGSVSRIWIDRLSAIRDTTASSAVFVMKDGTQQRLSLITDFRVLYLQEGSAKPEKLDLSKIRSLQMMESAK
jgi:hypothetical protein